MEIVKRAIRLGFDGVMIDGSTLPYKENIKLTKQVVTYAHKHNVSVEGELGVLDVADDDAETSGKAKFTDPVQAKEFVLLTGVDSLAVSIGTNHGVNKYVGEPKIRYDILKKIEKRLEKKRRKPGTLPERCKYCEVLGMCRRPESEGWRCYNGCILINQELEEKYRGLPKGCWRCKYLKKCRRPKEEGWKCYNGCRKIKKRA